MVNHAKKAKKKRKRKYARNFLQSPMDNAPFMYAFLRVTHKIGIFRQKYELHVTNNA